MQVNQFSLLLLSLGALSSLRHLKETLQFCFCRRRKKCDLFSVCGIFFRCSKQAILRSGRKEPNALHSDSHKPTQTLHCQAAYTLVSTVVYCFFLQWTIQRPLGSSEQPPSQFCWINTVLNLSASNYQIFRLPLSCGLLHALLHCTNYCGILLHAINGTGYYGNPYGPSSTVLTKLFVLNALETQKILSKHPHHGSHTPLNYLHWALQSNIFGLKHSYSVSFNAINSFILYVSYLIKIFMRLCQISPTGLRSFNQKK